MRLNCIRNEMKRDERVSNRYDERIWNPNKIYEGISQDKTRCNGVR